MFEILLALGLIVFIIWAIWKYTDVSSRLVSASQTVTLDPAEQKSLERMNEPTITSMEGVTAIHAEFEPTTVIPSPPLPPKTSLAVPLGTPDLPNRVENPDLGFECISDMPFLEPTISPAGTPDVVQIGKAYIPKALLPK